MSRDKITHIIYILRVSLIRCSRAVPDVRCTTVMEQQRQVSTTSGELVGSRQRSCLGDDYFAFKGIPYAEPPIGPLRFLDPKPVKPWTGIRKALEYGSISLQTDKITGEICGSEDCLYLNVYTKSLNVTERIPVMVWIHGGAFLIGSGNDDRHGPDYFMSKRVVLVTINYRLGIFGFLNLKDKVASGNQGLKDQVMALKWVKENIANFGGDPDNVTIFGSSAGGVSVHFQTMSPLSKGLFHKAICQSGNALTCWSIQRDPLKEIYELLDLMGFKERDPAKIVEFLRSTNSKKLIEYQERMMNAKRWLVLTFPFGPAVDDKSENPFLPVPVSVAAKEAVQMPLMIGYNSLEAIFVHRFLKFIGYEEMERNIEKYIFPDVKNLLKPYGNPTIKDLRQMYMKGKKLDKSSVHKFLEFWGDLGMIEPIHRHAKIQVENGAASTYLYILSYDKNITPVKMLLDFPIDGVGHSDEMVYQFRARKLYDMAKMDQLQPGTGADKIMRRMVELWVNFAQTGRPTPQRSELVPCYWQPLTSHVVLRYLNIDEELRMEKMLSIEQRYSTNKSSGDEYY